ncbi:armadillo-type protein [Tribonema minus]|uniref:Armadillo-type protein n=1 Tax=Tribonema minus TaxID=303371 RepID=A0A835Z172_9STRA|nr:armadillo-type protein [Tribonema minus]
MVDVKQQYGCEAIAQLAEDDASTDSLHAAGAIERVVAALLIHRGDARVQIAGLQAVKFLAESPVIRPHLCQLGAGEAIVAAMRQHTQNEYIQLRAARAMHAVLCDGNESTRARLVKAHAFTPLTSALIRHTGTRNMFTLNIVAHLIADLLDDETCAALTGAGVEALLAALTAAGATAAVTGPCLAAIVKLCCGGAGLAAELATDGACDAVMACARSCGGDPTVHACAWGAVASLCRDAGNVARLGARGACEALGAVLRDHATCQQIQLAGVAAARQLAMHDGNAARLAAVGCCEAVVAAMNLCHGDADMQQMAVSAIAMLAGSQQRAAQFGVPGCWAVLSAVRAFPLDDVIQQRGNRAMLALCSLDSNNRWLERTELAAEEDGAADDSRQESAFAATDAGSTETSA